MKSFMLLIAVMFLSSAAFAAKVDLPKFSPVAGTYTSVQTVSISVLVTTATIRYTLDGSSPSTTKGTIYTGPITISTSTRIKAIAYASGRNYGAELTVEKFFSNSYYGLFTASVYESKYTGSDGVEHNTAFNGNYVYNVLLGKEFKVGSGKRNKFSTDIKFTNAGGRHFTPIDLTASQMAGNTVLKGDDYAYTSSYDSYMRLDFKVGYVLNSKSKKISQTFSLDLQNVTNNQNVFSQSYDNGSKTIMTTYQLGFFPNFIYKLQF